MITTDLKRYNKKVFWPVNSDEKLKALCASLNCKRWKFDRAGHTFDRIRERLDLKDLINAFQGDFSLDYQNIFEYYLDGENIVKVVFKIPYTDKENLKMVLTSDKTIVTFWVNNINDHHLTLDDAIYNKE